MKIEYLQGRLIAVISPLTGEAEVRVDINDRESITLQRLGEQGWSLVTVTPATKVPLNEVAAPIAIFSRVDDREVSAERVLARIGAYIAEDSYSNAAR